MIRSFKDRKTQQFFEGHRVPSFQGFADQAPRLARFFGTTPQLWLNLQKTWELRRAEMEAGSSIAERVTPWSTDFHLGLMSVPLAIHTRGV